MTSATLTAPALTTTTGIEAWTIGAPRLLAGIAGTAGTDTTTAALNLTAHRVTHGPLPATDLRNLLALLDAVRLAGRGGAGFPFAAKLRALPADQRIRTVLVNGCESEPASAKDRVLLSHTPHLVLDGALTVAAAIGARRIVVAVHDHAIAATLEQAIAERPDARDVAVRLIVDRFVAGEGRALAATVAGTSPTADGRTALPPGRRHHATEKGTLLSNVETFAQVAVLVRLGAHRYAATGTHDEPGTTLLTISGAVARPGVVEIPTGTPLSIVLAAAGAVEPAAVITGGYHGTWAAPDPALLVSRAGLAAAGASFGAGVLIVLDHSTCALGELGRVTAWLAAESARQCGPCRFGLPALAADVQALYRGDASGYVAAERHVKAVDGRGACAHPDGAARFVTSGLRLLYPEVQAHLRGGCGRPVRSVLPIGPVA